MKRKIHTENMNGVSTGRSTKIFLLGAGFSYSYNPDFCPLTTGFLDKASQRGIFDPKNIHSGLAAFIHRYFGTDYRLINIETLATFLATRFIPSVQDQFEYKEGLYDNLIKIIVYTLKDSAIWKSPPNSDHKMILTEFANYLVNEKIDVLTFNYDLILDNFLRETQKWFVMDGYGCEIPSIGRLEINQKLKYRSAIKYIKLHGSLNWGTPIVTLPFEEYKKIYLNIFGYPGLPEPVTEIMTMEGTVSAGGDQPNIHYNTFIIPPIYGKNVDNSLIRYLWFLAREKIAFSNEIIVLGYSFPPSDIMAEFLFRQSLVQHGSASKKVTVVNKSLSDTYTKRVREIFFNSECDFIEDDAMAFLKGKILKI